MSLFQFTIHFELRFFTLLFFLTLVIVQNSFAQGPGSPSKEETISYLKATLAVDPLTQEVQRGKTTYFSTVKVLDVAFDDCDFRLKYIRDVIASNGFEGDTMVEELKLNIKDVEIIDGPSFTGLGIYALWFKARNNENLFKEASYFEGQTPEQMRATNEVVIPISEDKIYKGFSHLRRLCGAADPISFD